MNWAPSHDICKHLWGPSPCSVQESILQLPKLLKLSLNEIAALMDDTDCYTLSCHTAVQDISISAEKCSALAFTSIMKLENIRSVSATRLDSPQVSKSLQNFQRIGVNLTHISSRDLAPHVLIASWNSKGSAKARWNYMFASQQRGTQNSFKSSNTLATSFQTISFEACWGNVSFLIWRRICIDKW